MTPIIPHKKEKPLTSLASLGGGAVGLQFGGGAAEKVYGDDVYSTYVYRGNSTAGRNITNGIDLSGKGGLVWIKGRDSAYNHELVDTVRGAGYVLKSNSNSAQGGSTSSELDQFNSDGFRLNYRTGEGNTNNQDYASWTFREQEGFFDIVTYTGNATNRSISHSLGSVPGFIIVKRLNASEDWTCYHRGLGGYTSSGQYSHTQEFIDLNKTLGSQDDSGSVIWNNTAPTSTHFTVGTHARVNGNGDTYIAYLFAGGASTAATARSVVLDGTGDYLSCGSSSDFSFGTGDFTIEGWFKKDDTSQGGFWQVSTISGGLGSLTPPACAWTGSAWQMYGGGDNTNSYPTVIANKWYHIAQVRSSGVTTMYVDGVPVITRPDTANYDGTHIAIGGYYSTSFLHEGKISNFRVVKGTAVYTSSFRPPYEPLTNITNTVLLCCNNSSVTGSTVTPGTITANGNPTASTDSPFDDPEGFKFGEGEDQNMIKCGSYKTDSNEDANVYLGWEPQWVLAKRVDSSSGGADWMIVDSMRGFPNAQDVEDNSSGQCKVLEPNTSDDEITTSRLGITPTGFYADQFGSGRSFIYVAVRRPDGYVSKPPELGTGVFAMDSGTNAGGIIPAHDSGFPVDFQLNTKPDSNWDKYAGARLFAEKYLATNTMTQEQSSSGFQYDSNVGWGTGNQTGYFSWMWKRHAGFDVVTYRGNGTAGHAISHNLSKTPEMMWIRRRNSNEDWEVYHKGLNGGTNPQNYGIKLNYNTAYHSSGADRWGAPTATYFTVNTDNGTNNSSGTYVAMLFASVDGISKVGYYTGTGGTRTITLGFQPRLLIYRKVSSTQDWFIIDTERGWGSGDDKYLELNNTNDEDAFPFGEPTSDGYTIADYGNSSGAEFIYYAHA